MPKNKKILVTMGEPAGIGPDIILMAWLKRASLDLPEFDVIGDANILRGRAACLNISIEISEIDRWENSTRDNAILNVIGLEKPMNCSPGTPDANNAKGVIEAISRGADFVADGQYGALVTCPINKAVLYDAAFDFPGHTEFLAHLAQANSSKNVFPVMMLAGGGLRTVPITIHIALEQVVKHLSRELIEKTVRIVASELRRKFGIENPIIALAALNPHAGENGAMGNQEQDYINASVAALRAEGININGPLPADTMFHERARKNYDVAVCMYHDQALIPLKTLAFDEGVNITLGLPFIRTSPDHGTAFNIAGTGNARPDSLIAAIKMAHEMTQKSSLRH